MMIKKLFFILTYLCLCSCVLLAQQYSQNCLQPVVLLQNSTKEASGSAVIIQSTQIDKDNYLNIILSCEHVFKFSMIATTMKHNEGFIESDSTYTVQPIYLSEDKDLSLAAFISDKQLSKAVLDMDSIPTIKDQVFNIGCGLGDPPRYSEGIITGLGPTKKDFSSIQTSIYIVPGDSGSPLFYKNKIIGISSFIKSYSRDGRTYAANGLSVFKSTKLIRQILSSPKYDFILDDKKNHPRVLSDYIWLKDAKLFAD